MKRIELLCPAKNVDTAKDAIHCGADSVYIGADAFGARTAAANSVEEIAELCDFAHLYGCKVCVALNTILDDDEIPQASNLARKLRDVGVDALIVQDLGLLEYGLPPMSIHASTQCHTTTPTKAKFLEACGFSTIVLARELSLSETKNIASQLSADTLVECFAHGALCVSYSGQCKLSYAIGGRSGNRGECAQPCRMKYELLDANKEKIAPTAHYLSLRDMNRSKSIGDMLEAGVSIFKIEGRLKDGGYVKNTTALYRKILDNEIEKRGLARLSYGESKIYFLPNPEKTFSRGFCQYHLRGIEKNCASFETPKARGEYIGKAKKIFDGGFFFPNASEIFSNGDGLAFVANGESMGAEVRKVEGEKVFVGRPEDKFKPLVNSKIFRNKDTKFESLLEKKCERKMGVKIDVEARAQKIFFKMTTLDDRHISTEVVLENFELALDTTKATKNISENISKLGTTPFKAERVEINLDNIPFLRMSEINAIRRELSENLQKEILRKYREQQNKFVPLKPNFNFAPDSSIERDADANVRNNYAKNFYKKFGIEISELAAESRPPSELQGKRVMQTKHCILRELGMCKKENKIKEPLFLKNDSTTLQLQFDCALCGMNIILK